MSSKIEQISQSIYSVPAGLKVFGLIALNTRMTIVRFGNGDLWLHSPIKANETLFEEVSKLGTVKWLVSPNLFHHMFVEQWSLKFPEAKIIGCKGLEKKQPNLHIANIRQKANEFLPDIQTISIEGCPVLKENLFFHIPSKTLIVADLFFYNPNITGFTKGYFWLNKVFYEPNIPYLVKSSIKDRKRFLTSLQQLKTLDVQNISMCHHHILQNDSKSHINRIIQNLHN